jgi:DNA-binding response OmpR family regulator
MRIIIVNTDREMTQNICMTLNSFQPNWQLIIIDTGRKCLDIINHKGCPDAFIVGMQLSDMTGFNLTELIRDDCDAPIIILSAKNDIEMLVKAFDAGANDFVVSPFNKSIFVARLKALIRRRNWDIQTTGHKSDNNRNQPIKCLSSCNEYGNID